MATQNLPTRTTESKTPSTATVNYVTQDDTHICGTDAFTYDLDALA
jgi:hypothetical protein